MHEFIDALEELVERALRLPATGKVLIDEAALREVIENLRSAAPEEIKMGQRIASERERILAEARAQSRRMIEEAQAQLNTRLDEQAVVQAARQRAREIVADAEQQAATLRRDANQYVISQLSGLETRLQRLLREVQNGQRLLSGESGSRGDSVAS